MDAEAAALNGVRAFAFRTLWLVNRENVRDYGQSECDKQNKEDVYAYILTVCVIEINDKETSMTDCAFNLSMFFLLLVTTKFWSVLNVIPS